MQNLNDDATQRVNTQEAINTRKKSVVAGEEIVLEDENNNTNSKNSDERTKKLLSGKLLIGAICIASIVLCVVIYKVCVSKNNVDENGNKVEKENQLVITEKETYEGLNYSSEKEQLEKQGFFYNYSKSLEGSKVDVSYIKVGDLKDTSLETKINNVLKERALMLYDSNDLQDSKVLYDHIYNYTDVYIFNNVLSTMYCEEKSDVDGNVVYNFSSVNINLKEFEEFALKDVFISDANISEIIKANTGVDYDDNTIFSVSPKFVYIIKANGTKDAKLEKINIYKNKEQIAIYKRFYVEKKAFNKTFNATPYAYTTKKFIETDIYGKEENNLFIDTCNVKIQDKEYSQELKYALNNVYKDAVNKARNLSYSNPSKRYLVQIIPSIEKVSDKEYTLKVKSNTYEINKQFFDIHIIEFVVASENKYNDESVIVDYFDNTALNAADKLNQMDTSTITKKVNQKGEEIKNTSNDTNGIS